MLIDYKIIKKHISFMWIFAKNKKILNNIIDELNINKNDYKIIKTTRKELGNCYCIKMYDSLGHNFDKYSFYLENNYKDESIKQEI